ncbi:MAG: hypothetical protein KDJ65_26365 [Anaerolineae bacterium]|nr:hypothetical protein [Anaerolineae bacterium]
MEDTSRSQTISTKLQAIAKQAIDYPEMVFTTLAHHIDVEWLEVKTRLKGRSFLVRFADDFIIGCELENDAQRVMTALPKRFGRYGLTIHPSFPLPRPRIIHTI